MTTLLEINAGQIIKLESLRKVLEECVKPWHGDYTLEVRIGLAIEEKDTSTEYGEDGWSAGSITRLQTPEALVFFNMYQFEDEEWIMKMPYTPSFAVPLSKMNVDFYIDIFKKIYLEKPPTEEEWEEAKKKLYASANCDENGDPLQTLEDPF